MLMKNNPAPLNQSQARQRVLQERGCPARLEPAEGREMVPILLPGHFQFGRKKLSTFLGAAPRAAQGGQLQRACPGQGARAREPASGFVSGWQLGRPPGQTSCEAGTHVPLTRAHVGTLVPRGQALPVGQTPARCLPCPHPSGGPWQRRGGPCERQVALE